MIVQDYLPIWINAFIVDRKARGLTNNTLLYYQRKLKQFNDYAESQVITRISQIDATTIRSFLLWMGEDHNPGGVRTSYRALRSFLHWYEEETDETTMIHKVKAPKVPIEPLEGVTLETVLKMVDTCESGSFTGDRDATILLALFDTGCRARELLSIQLADVNQMLGDVLIRSGKGRKPRTVYFGKATRKALRRYLQHRTDNNPALFITIGDNSRLSYSGLREAVGRRAKLAGMAKQPSLHSFRRGFAITMLRSKTDLYTLARMMGHTDITVLKYYLKLTDVDTAEAHRRASPVDNSFN